MFPPTQLNSTPLQPNKCFKCSTKTAQNVITSTANGDYRQRMVFNVNLPHQWVLKRNNKQHVRPGILSLARVFSQLPPLYRVRPACSKTCLGRISASSSAAIRSPPPPGTGLARQSLALTSAPSSSSLGRTPRPCNKKKKNKKRPSERKLNQVSVRLKENGEV